MLSSCALSFINYLDAHKYEGKMCVSNGECEDIENAFHNAMWDRLHRYLGDKECVEFQAFLKSIVLQNTWKPSDEQMKTLCFVKKAKILDPEERESLNSLYIQLKKLREE